MSQQPSLTAAPTLLLRSTGQEGSQKEKRTQDQHPAGHYGPQALSLLEDTTVLTAKQFLVGLGTKVGQARKLESPECGRYCHEEPSLSQGIGTRLRPGQEPNLLCQLEAITQTKRTSLLFAVVEGLNPH